MLLKCKKFRSPRFNVLVIPMGAGKTLTFNSIGATQEVDDKAGYDIMAKYNENLEIVQGAPAPEPEPKAKEPAKAKVASDKRK